MKWWGRNVEKIIQGTIHSPIVINGGGGEYGGDGGGDKGEWEVWI